VSELIQAGRQGGLTALAARLQRGQQAPGDDSTSRMMVTADARAPSSPGQASIYLVGRSDADR
jgi:hypothetical protein